MAADPDFYVPLVFFFVPLVLFPLFVTLAGRLLERLQLPIELRIGPRNGPDSLNRLQSIGLTGVCQLQIRLFHKSVSRHAR